MNKIYHLKSKKVMAKIKMEMYFKEVALGAIYHTQK